MDKRYHMAVHVIRILLYAVVFVAFLFLFTNFSSVEVDGQEYFSPEKNPLLLWASIGMGFVVVILAVAVWHIHRKTEHLEHSGHERPIAKAPKAVKISNAAKVKSMAKEIEPDKDEKAPAPKLEAPKKKLFPPKPVAPAKEDDIEKELARITKELKNL